MASSGCNFEFGHNTCIVFTTHCTVNSYAVMTHPHPLVIFSRHHQPPLSLTTHTLSLFIYFNDYPRQWRLMANPICGCAFFNDMVALQLNRARYSVLFATSSPSNTQPSTYIVRDSSVYNNNCTSPCCLLIIKVLPVLAYYLQLVFSICTIV